MGDQTHEPPIFQLNPKQNETDGGGWISNRGYGFSAPIWPWWFASTEREHVQIDASWASNTSSWVYIYRSNKFLRAKSMPIHGWTGWRWVMDSVSLPGILEAHHERKRRHDLFKATQSGNLNAMEIRHLFDDFFLRNNGFTCDVQLSSWLKEGECQHWKSTLCWSKLWSPQQQIGVPNGPQLKRSCY